MSRSRLSIHGIPHHHPDAIVHLAREIRPPVILLVNPEPGIISRCYEVSPGSIFSLRNHALSEQKDDMYNNALATGQRHASEMSDWCDRMFSEARERGLPMPPLANVILPGINEPLVNEDHQIAAVVTYNVAYLDGLRARGKRGSALEFSVGWPRNSGADTPPEWHQWRPVYEAVKRGNHIVSMHEYWPVEGPSYWAGWLCYRLVMNIPDYWADVPFIMTECGLDDAAVPGRRHAFWKDFFLQNPHAYVQQYREYEWNCRSLTNKNGVRIDILGYCIFTLDYGGPEWENADITQILNLFIDFVRSTDMPDPPAQETIHLPSISVPEPPTPPSPTPHIPVESPSDAMTWVVQSMSRIFGYDSILVQAILKVESGGRAFQGGRPIIRNEIHILYDQMQNKALWARHFRNDPVERWKGQQWRQSEADPWRNIHVDQATEWQVFEFARSLDSRAAHLALGMGAAQIMGFNYRIAEYLSPEQMLQSFSDEQWGGANQIVAMFAYFYKVDGLADAIRTHDLETIALKYNGPGQVPYYVQRFQEEINALRNA